MNAIITGASRGIGKAVAEKFASNGYDLLLCSRNETHLLQTAEELRKKFSNITIQAKAFDLGKKHQAMLFGEWLIGNAASIDVLVNNVGTYVPVRCNCNYFLMRGLSNSMSNSPPKTEVSK